IRRYDRRYNTICRECRNSEVMQRVLTFYRRCVQENNSLHNRVLA
ncbi:DUF977 family protein, partial [Escherichia coli]|nr:DUF977 family protein [Escherichia coli]